jgi:lipoprotein-anchoring transpeptidase ErfK/SrfK
MMSDSQVNFDQAMDNARQAAERGDDDQAKHWAKFAAIISPKEDTPWLFLGDLAAPENKFEFYAKALEADPQSEAARKRLGEAVRQIRQAEEIHRPDLNPKIRLGAPFVATIKKRTSLLAGTMPLFFMACFGLVVWLAISSLTVLAETTAGFFPTATAVSYIAPRANLITPTPTPTATFTPTQTPTPTPTPTQTASPTPTRTRTPRPPAPTAVPPFTGQRPGYIGSNEFWIEVDLSSQRMITYRGDQVLNTFTVSTGKSSTPTVTGSFQIYIKLSSQTMRGPGYVQPDVPYVMYFYKDYSIHGTYWHNKFGTAVSHGCVNLPTGNASWVYQYAKIGTWVIIHP